MKDPNTTLDGNRTFMAWLAHAILIASIRTCGTFGLVLRVAGNAVNRQDKILRKFTTLEYTGLTNMQFIHNLFYEILLKLYCVPRQLRTSA